MSKQKTFYEQIGIAMTCRSFEEYVRMFSCEPEALEGAAVLDVAAGASSFAAGARQRGIRAVSADPLYRLSGAEMEAHGKAELAEAAAKLAAIQQQFNWSYYGSPEAHSRKREESLQLFLEDYRRLAGTDAYVPAALPQLPFSEGTFSHIFCSHFLFLYAEQFSYEFHLESLLELIRICRPDGEVRVYPLLDLKWRPYPKLQELMGELNRRGCSAELLESGLPFIPGSGKLLRIVKPGKENV